ncbi:ribbon-helix-helix domain-containing protein [Nisaea sp.]|uniref:ribbon-helix-helix domain-containing protein n=1 Tax=Nisaea sp. TaxID=2024842 RepID=UPI003B51827B
MSAADPTRLRKRTVTVSGHQTSISLEEAFWEALKQIARRRGLSINTLVSEVDATRTGNLSSALRVFVLAELQSGGAGSVSE